MGNGNTREIKKWGNGNGNGREIKSERSKKECFFCIIISEQLISNLVPRALSLFGWVSRPNHVHHDLETHSKNVHPISVLPRCSHCRTKNGQIDK